MAYFANVSALKAATGLPSNGDVVTLDGYYSSLDGGGGQLVLRDALSGEEENGGTTFLLSDGRIAERLYSGSVNVDWFGAKGNGDTSVSIANTNIINGIVRYLNQKGGGVIEFSPGKTYAINRFNDQQAPSIRMRQNVSIEGNNATLLLANDAAFIGADWNFGITLTNAGSGYTSSPTVTITGGGGSGAAGSALVAGGKIISISLSPTGSGYTSAPTISISGGGGSGATATAAFYPIAASVSAGANTLDLAYVTGLSVGDPIFCRIGQNAYDGNEPRLTCLATVTAISGNTITLDRAFTEAISISGASLNNSCVFKITNMWWNGYVRNLTFRNASGNQAEEGINLVGCKNIRISGITNYDHVGAGLVAGQFSENIFGNSLTCYSNPNPSAQGSFGRLFGFSNCTNVQMSDFYGANLAGSALFFIESYCRNIQFTNFQIDDLLPKSGNPGFAFVVQEAEATFSNYLYRSINVFKETDNGGTPSTVVIRDARYELSQRPYFMDALQNFGKLDVTINGERSIYDFGSQYYYTIFIPLKDGLYEYHLTPPGIGTEVEIYAPSWFNAASHLSSLYMGRWGSDGTGDNGSDVASSIVAGSRVKLANINSIIGTVAGAGYADQHRRMGGGQILVTTPGSGVTSANVYLVIRIRMAPSIVGSTGYVTQQTFDPVQYGSWYNGFGNTTQIPDTSGATLSVLEGEVNKVKRALRNVNDVKY
jgi:hypothetical protein